MSMFANTVFASFIEAQFLGPDGVPMSERERTLKEYRDHIAKLRRPPPPPHDPAVIAPWRRALLRAVTSRWCDAAVSCAIAANAATELTRHDAQSAALGRFQDRANAAFSALFALEVGAKVLALGPTRYFHSRAHVFDAAVTACALLDAQQTVLGCGAHGGDVGSPALRALRSLRAFRLARLLLLVPEVDKLYLAVVHPLPLVLRVLGVLLAALFVFASLGCLLFARASRAALARARSDARAYPHEHAHFGDLYHGITIVFIFGTGEQWTDGLTELVGDRDAAPVGMPYSVFWALAHLYFITLILALTAVMMNLFVMVICDAFDALDSPHLLVIERTLPLMADAWAAADATRAGRLPRAAMRGFLRAVPAPIGCGAGASDEEVALRVLQIHPSDMAARGTARELAYRDVLLQLVAHYLNAERRADREADEACARRLHDALRRSSSASNDGDSESEGGESDARENLMRAAAGQFSARGLLRRVRSTKLDGARDRQGDSTAPPSEPEVDEESSHGGHALATDGIAVPGQAKSSEL